MNSELLYITRKLGYPSSFGTRAGLGDFLEQYPDGVYAENRGGAPIGWESAAVWFGGDSERAAARFERMMSERNELSRVFRTRIAGVLLLTFIYRLKSRMVTAIPIIGGQPQPIDPTWLYFTMPQGGTVSLTKNGTPTEVTLEYSLDNGSTWTEWVESENVRSLTLTAGQTMHVRNTSETSTRFSTDSSSYYKFVFSTNTYAGGNTDSLLCKNPSNAVITAHCYKYLFTNSLLVSAPQLPSINLSQFCYASMFSNCTQLIDCPDLPAIRSQNYCYYGMFNGCVSIVIAPEIKFTNLDYACCYMMFYNCTSLTTPPSSFNCDIQQTSALNSTFYNCSSLTKAPDINIKTCGTNGLYNCFANCSSLNYVKVTFEDISATDCLRNWLSNVSPTGDFYCPAELTIPTGASGIPSGWTRHDI